MGQDRKFFSATKRRFILASNIWVTPSKACLPKFSDPVSAKLRTFCMQICLSLMVCRDTQASASEVILRLCYNDRGLYFYRKWLSITHCKIWFLWWPLRQEFFSANFSVEFCDCLLNLSAEHLLQYVCNYVRYKYL